MNQIFETLARQYIEKLKQNELYREFMVVDKVSATYPGAQLADGIDNRRVFVWCSNDYLGMAHSLAVKEAMVKAIEKYGTGSGGSRNIGGTHSLLSRLENVIAEWMGKEAALCFPTGFGSNDYTLQALADIYNAPIFYSDEKNHASIINGMLATKCEKRVFRHNDATHLRELLAADACDRLKVVVFESLYSMDGDMSPIQELVSTAKEFGAMTLLDEVHAVGIYGRDGAGLASEAGVEADIEILQGTMGKAIGLIGGYIAGSKTLMDAVRSASKGFIFTTSLPPCIAAGCLESIRLIRSDTTARTALLQNTETLKSCLADNHITFYDASRSHVVPIIIGDEARCRTVSRLMLDQFDIYIPPVVYPSVRLGTARLRACASPLHTDADIEYFARSLRTAYDLVGMP